MIEDVIMTEKLIQVNFFCQVYFKNENFFVFKYCSSIRDTCRTDVLFIQISEIEIDFINTF